jgi:N-acyl-D-amino-acid deacylase
VRVAAIRLVAALVAVAGPASAQESFDVLIRNGRVLDGSGNPWFRADVGLRGDRIAAIGDLSRATAAQVIDATDLYVAPGFIDTHSHAGRGLTTPALSPAVPLLAQGITSVLVNPDGGGPIDLAAQRAALLRHGLGVNVGQLVPHGSVREAVLGMQDRLANAEELARMRELVRRGMSEGAFGLSSGPFYAPGSYSDTAELVALARVAAESGGAYQSHVRDESSYTIGVLAAVDEVIAVARGARLPAVVTHVKALGRDVWGFSTAIALRIQAARDAGLEVWADQYPYEASATGLAAALLPRWAQAGGSEALRGRLRDGETRERIRAEVALNLERRGGAARIQFRLLPADPTFAGRTLADLARARGQDPVEVALALVEEGSPGIVSFAMLESDVRSLMRQPWTLTASDGDLVPFGEGVPHPRSYGTFPRKLRRYALDEAVVTLEEALRGMTSLPAAVYRIRDRGVLRAGAFADVVVLDAARLRDRATYAEPHQLAEGIVHVFVNGRPALRDGAPTAERAGRVLRRDAP